MSMRLQLYRFRDVATLINGRAYLMPELQDVGKYRIVRVGNFSGKDEWFYSDMELEDDKYCKKGDLLYKWACNFGPEIWKEEKVIYHYHIWKILCTEQVDKNFLFYYLKFQTPHWLGGTNGTTMVHITKQSMERKKILIPADVEQQQKIASILSSYDDLIENNNKRIKILEQMAENLYKEWFVRFRFPCRSKIILQKRSPNGWVISSKATDMVCPENWEYGSFSRLGKFVRGKNITADKMIEGNIPVVSAGLEPSGYHNVHNVTGKSLTISASGANAGYLKYHLSDIWAADCSYFQDDSKLWFVYNALKFLQPVISNLQIGAAQPHVYPKNINKLCTVIPDDDTMHMYCEKVEPIYEQIQRLKEENQNLIKQRDMLLPRLMSGKLEVK